MDERSEPVCGDCIGFNIEQRDDQGMYRGTCRFRRELGMIPEDLPFCPQFHVRRDRADKILIPKRAASKKRRSSGIRQTKLRNVRPDKPTLKDWPQGDTSGEIQMDREGLKQVLRELLEAETMYGYPEMSQRWEGGTMVLKPADSNNQPKEVPLDSFFHKIVMIRDRLRVLEAKINSQNNLSEQSKIELQSYISKCYGTLTTFNVLFGDKADYFRSK